MTTEPFRAARIVRSASFDIAAPPSVVFPLLCPVREREWLPGWHADIVYSRSGLAEADCVFESPNPKLGRGLYVVSRYEPERAIEFIIFYSGRCVVKLAVALEQMGTGTRLRWSRTYTGLSTEGNAAIGDITESVFGEQTHQIAAWLSEYCQRLQSA